MREEFRVWPRRRKEVVLEAEPNPNFKPSLPCCILGESQRELKTGWPSARTRGKTVLPKQSAPQRTVNHLGQELVGVGTAVSQQTNTTLSYGWPPALLELKS